MRVTAPGIHLLRRALVVAQVALATVLLASAGLLLRSVERIFAQPTGFDASRVLAMQIDATGTDVPYEGLQALFEQVVEAVRAVPGVTEAALASQHPLTPSLEMYRVNMEVPAAGDPESAALAFRNVVTPGWFETMGVPLKRGRLFGPEDRPDAPQAIVVNESFAARRFPGRDPIGERVRIGPYTQPNLPPGTIVGVVGDVKQSSLTESADAFYVAMGQWAWMDAAQSLVVQTAADPVTLVEPIKQAIWSVNPAVPIMRIQTMADLVGGSEARRTFALAVFAAFGLAALLLAGVGVYGVIEERVTERTREIGLRSALGATPTRLAAFVVIQGLTLTIVGIVIGVAVAANASQAIASLLFGIAPFDLVTYLGVAALLLAITFIACYAPAFRAARIDPAVTLRAD
jgi:predicted permease